MLRNFCKIFNRFIIPKQLRDYSICTITEASAGIDSNQDHGDHNQISIDNMNMNGKYYPIDIDMEKMDDDEIDKSFEEIECEDIPLQKRSGVYQSKGIKIYIPQEKMNPGTMRYRVDRLPKTIPDDIRVIYFN